MVKIDPEQYNMIKTVTDAGNKQISLRYSSIIGSVSLLTPTRLVNTAHTHPWKDLSSKIWNLDGCPGRIRYDHQRILFVGVSVAVDSIMPSDVLASSSRNMSLAVVSQPISCQLWTSMNHSATSVLECVSTDLKGICRDFTCRDYRWNID
jgi:hypothetical protein